MVDWIMRAIDESPKLATPLQEGTEAEVETTSTEGEEGSTQTV